MHRRRQERDSWLTVDPSAWMVAASPGASIPPEVHLATKILDKDAAGRPRWPHSVLLYQYGEFHLPIGVDDILMAEPKGYISGEMLGLVSAFINATIA